MIEATEEINNAGCKSPGLPQTLHILLENSEKEGQEDIVSWVADGTAFKIHKKEAFIQHIMPRYFDTASFKSYQRSINLWGLYTVRKGALKGYTAHSLFRRGQRELSRSMKRIRIKGTGKKRTSPNGQSSNSMFLTGAGGSVDATRSTNTATSNEKRRPAVWNSGVTPLVNPAPTTTTSPFTFPNSNGLPSRIAFPPGNRILDQAAAHHHQQHDLALLSQLLAPQQQYSTMMGTQLLYLDSMLAANRNRNVGGYPFMHPGMQGMVPLPAAPSPPQFSDNATLVALLSILNQKPAAAAPNNSPGLSALMSSVLEAQSSTNTKTSSSPTTVVTEAGPLLGAGPPAATTETSSCDKTKIKVEDNKDNLMIAGLLHLMQKKNDNNTNKDQPNGMPREMMANSFGVATSSV